MNRRLFLATAALLPGASASAQGQRSVRRISVQDLPGVSLAGCTATMLEVTYPPNAGSEPHRHPGFVLGYVLEGAIRFGVDGGPEVVYRAGESFYEGPGVLHTLSANASATTPARFLAVVLAEKGAPVTTTP